jgi:hypothetical protein
VITDWAPDNLVEEVRAAEAAARAARAVPGVVRLQPGVLGLLGRLAAEAWEQATGMELPDIAGVHAEIGADGMEVEVRIVVDGGYRAADVGVAVQVAVGAVVPASAVRVHVVEIDLSADRPSVRPDGVP